MFNLKTKNFNIGGSVCAFHYQATSRGTFVFVHDEFVFRDMIIKDFEKFLKYFGAPILCGRAVESWWVRPDVRHLYFGMPDDFTVDMAWGKRLGQSPIAVKVTSEGEIILSPERARKARGTVFVVVSPREVLARKTVSITGWWGKGGGSQFLPTRKSGYIEYQQGYVGPPPERKTDLIDCYLLMLTINEKRANKMARLYGLVELLKTEYADLYEELQVRNLLTPNIFTPIDTSEGADYIDWVTAELDFILTGNEVTK